MISKELDYPKINIKEVSRIRNRKNNGANCNENLSDGPLLLIVKNQLEDQLILF